MRIRNILSLLLLILITSCIDMLDQLSYQKERDRLIENIRNPINGVVIDTISYRKNLRSTHLIINTGDTIFPTNIDIMNNIIIGDSIYKLRDDNYIYLVNVNTNTTRKFWYKKIPMKYRKDSEFPEEWKDKWLESSN